MDQQDFEDVRPYFDFEIPDAVQRVSENIYFSEIVKKFFPVDNIRTFSEKFKKIKTINEFQVKIMNRVIWAIVNQTIDNLSYSGFESISPDKKGIFISNHRDILLDAAILQILLFKHDLDTSEISFGSNLMLNPFIVDVGKMNKMFKLIRGGSVREVLINSKNVSDYMRYAITQKKQSVWIAQRNGRTKDGDDKTEVAVLKMFAMSSKLPFVDNFMEINLMPLAISYEFEPCDFMKVREVYISHRKQYEKESGEDFISIKNGITQQKGNVSMVVCEPVTREELEECNKLNQNEKFKKLAKIIDKRIYSNYKLWKTNYLAFDMLNQTTQFSNYYSQEDKEYFTNYMNTGLANIEGDINELTTIFLNIYANPVINWMKN